jgi:coenzyme F420-dependent glucose-6-phosphate dehydrogenase
MQASYGLTLGCEEHGPRDLVDLGRRAEDAGFDFCSISDHFHPWIDAQGHSPFVWSVLGALAQATDEMQVGVGVTCPIMRIHPAVLAQAAATTSLLFEGRFFFGIGTGEALNEHILGHRWPPADVRLEMLDESITVMRDLWTGEEISHDGKYFRVENARIYDPPADDLPLVISAFGPKAATLAAERGDGLWNTSPDEEITATYEESGGKGPRYAQLTICYGEDEKACRDLVAEQWPNSVFPGQLAQDVSTPALFQELADQATEDQAVGSIPCGPDLDQICESVQEFLDSGYDHLYFHQVGDDQGAFIGVWEKELGEQIRALTPG